MITLTTNVQAGITGFENPTIRFRKQPLNLQTLFVHSHTSMRIISADNSYQKFGIAKGDWLLIDSALQALATDLVLFEYHGESHIARWNVLCQHIAASGKAWDELHVMGVISVSIHHFRQPPPLPWHCDLTEIDLHQLIVTQEHSTLLCRAAGVSMLPHIWDRDILILERHLTPENDDVIVLALNNDLVVKRINVHTKTLYSDNSSFKPYPITQDDYTRLHGVVRYSLRLHRAMPL